MQKALWPSRIELLGGEGAEVLFFPVRVSFIDPVRVFLPKPNLSKKMLMIHPELNLPLGGIP